MLDNSPLLYHSPQPAHSNEFMTAVENCWGDNSPAFFVLLREIIKILAERLVTAELVPAKTRWYAELIDTALVPSPKSELLFQS